MFINTSLTLTEVELLPPGLRFIAVLLLVSVKVSRLSTEYGIYEFKGSYGTAQHPAITNSRKDRHLPTTHVLSESYSHVTSLESFVRHVST